ncbi:MAG TPA: hypothetical protein VKU89_10660 [Solirubrobacteraceae bacterium]|nr:hypothetical protein [Solirubrobacteraceae bacterium]
MQIELLYWEGCPSHPKALEQLREQIAALGIGQEVSVRRIESEEQAATEHFVGSPTIRVDGADVVDPGEQPPALNCRVYRTREGRYSPTPDPQDVRAALVAAQRRERR